jgi:hypothetical protein
MIAQDFPLNLRGMKIYFEKEKDHWDLGCIIKQLPTSKKFRVDYNPDTNLKKKSLTFKFRKLDLTTHNFFPAKSLKKQAP